MRDKLRRPSPPVANSIFFSDRIFCIRQIISVVLLCSAFVFPRFSSAESGSEIRGETFDDCRTLKTADVISYASTESAAGIPAARQQALRYALIDGLQMAAGGQVARSMQMQTESSLEGINQTAREHVVVRSEGRVLGWEILSERAKRGAIEHARVDLHVRVYVCLDDQSKQPMVVAIASGPPYNNGYRADDLVKFIAPYINKQPNLAVVFQDPTKAYHDIRINFSYDTATELVDNTARANTLAQFGAGGMITQDALTYQLLRASATVIATRFIDEATVSETVERRKRLPIGDDTQVAMRELLFEAYYLAGKGLAARLGEGVLDY